MAVSGSGSGQAATVSGSGQAARSLWREPERVAEIHRAFIDAGAELIETNTFSANRFKLADFGWQDEVASINEAGVKLAREVIAKVGIADPAIDTADGIVLKDDYLRYLAGQDQSARRWDKLRTQSPSPYRFWYRQSPRYFNTSDEIRVDSPALDISGMTSLYLDLDGHLHWFVHVPPQREAAAATSAQVDWSMLFHEAGLEIPNFRAATSTWIPLHAYDARAAWDGIDNLHPEIKIHVEAASFQGKPIYFETIYPWDQPARQELPPATPTRLSRVSTPPDRDFSGRLKSFYGNDSLSR